MSEPALAIRKARTDDRPVWDVVLGVYGYPAVLVAHRLKLFSLLGEEPRTLPEVCAALKIERRPAEAILTVATSVGFLQLQDGRYSLTPLSEDYLLETSPTYFGWYLDLIIDNYSVCSFESLMKAVRTNSPQAYGGGDIFKSHEEQAEAARAFTRGMHGISIGAALVWPEVIDLSKYRLMLDIGGGSGAHSIGTTSKWPNLQAIVFDLAAVCDVAQEFASRSGLEKRIRVQAGDMWQDPYPPADLHLYSNVFCDWPPEKCRFLAEKSFGSLGREGRIIVHDKLFNDAKTGPFRIAAFNMIMLLWVPGQAYSGRELSAMLTEAGFSDIEVKPVFGIYSIVTGRKP